MVAPFYLTPTPDDPGECINFIPQINGTIKTIEATKNAVIVQLFEGIDNEGKPATSRAVCIECIDEEMLPVLKAEALRILDL